MDDRRQYVSIKVCRNRKARVERCTSVKLNEHDVFLFVVCGDMYGMRKNPLFMCIY